jgi:1-acyl-sn-glycerol-3-phosphate acyltransferase
VTPAPLPACLRRALRLGHLLLHVLAGAALVGLAFPLLRPLQRDGLIMAWSKRLLRTLGIEARVGGVPTLPRGALLVCNHVSWLDIFLIYTATRVHFVSKSEVRRWPLAGWLAHRVGTLFLERGRRADTVRVNAEMRALMADGAWVAVFPEGTTSDGRGLKRFLPSLLQPAVDLGCPVVPAALAYRTSAGAYSAAPAYIEQMSLWQSLRQIAGEPGLVAELRFGDAIAPDKPRRELAAQAEAAVAALLGIRISDAASADSSPQTPDDLPA